jgi:hypothetical protein
MPTASVSDLAGSKIVCRLNKPFYSATWSESAVSLDHGFSFANCAKPNGHLERERRLIPDPEQSWLDLDSREPMDNVGSASINYHIAIGPHSGSRKLTLHDPSFIRTDIAVKASTADRDGFSLNAAV